MENMYHHYIIIAMIFYGRPTPKTHFSFISYSMCWTLKTFIVYIWCWLDKKEACHHYFRIMSIFSLSLTFIAQASLWKNQQTHWSLSNIFFLCQHIDYHILKQLTLSSHLFIAGEKKWICEHLNFSAINTLYIYVPSLNRSNAKFFAHFFFSSCKYLDDRLEGRVH